MHAHTTALAYQRLVEGLADVSLAINDANTFDELFELWMQFKPIYRATTRLGNSVAEKIELMQNQRES